MTSIAAVAAGLLIVAGGLAVVLRSASIRAPDSKAQRGDPG